MKRLRRFLVIVSAALLAVGVVMVYSASAIHSQETMGSRGYYLIRHLSSLGIGLILAVALLGCDMQWIRRHLKVMVGCCILLLVLVLLPGIGHEVSGARRWFRLGFLSFQPSEAAQLVVILYMADVLARKQDRLRSFVHGFLPPMLVLGTFLGLILLEPDLGTAFVMAVVTFMMLFVSGIKPIHLGPALASGLPILALLILAKPYRVRRIVAFADPWADPLGSGFQLIQSLVAVGAGGLFGVGLGQSAQKLYYLPAGHTDFIYSLIGEELGLMGTTVVLVLFVLFVVVGLRMAYRSHDLFAQLAGVGITAWVGLKAMVHMAVTTGLIPTKGLPLPFVSYGGSSLIFSLLGVALLLNLSREIPVQEPKAMMVPGRTG